MTEQYDQGPYDQDGRIEPVEITERTSSLTNPLYAGMEVDPSTPKCSKMRADIEAAQGDLAAAAKKLKSGPPDNEYQLT